MVLPTFEVVRIERLRTSARRGIVFLRQDQNEELNAFDVFEKLPEKLDRKIRAHFDYWLDGGICDDYFHGFPNAVAYKDCFVFKWKVAGTYHRIYGFLCRPLPQTNKAFNLCVLCTHATKNQFHTDPRELDGANLLSSNIDVKAALKAVYPDTMAKARQ